MKDLAFIVLRHEYSRSVHENGAYEWWAGQDCVSGRLELQQ